MTLLDEILSAEQQAADQKRDVLQSARESVRVAEAEAVSYIAQKNDEAKQTGKQLLQFAQAQADEQAALVEARSKQECEALKDTATKKIPEAKAYILGRIVK